MTWNKPVVWSLAGFAPMSAANFFSRKQGSFKMSLSYLSSRTERPDSRGSFHLTGCIPHEVRESHNDETM